MLADGVLVVEQTVIRQSKWSCDQQHFTLAFTGYFFEARSDQSVGHVKPEHLYDCSNCIHQIVLEEKTKQNKTPTPLYLGAVAEGQ